MVPPKNTVVSLCILVSLLLTHVPCVMSQARAYTSCAAIARGTVSVVGKNASENVLMFCSAIDSTFRSVFGTRKSSSSVLKIDGEEERMQDFSSAASLPFSPF